MLTKLKKQWHDLTQGKPGQRFQMRYERRKNRRSALWKPLYLILGTALLLAGVVLMPAPGPGFIVVFIGAAMLAEESLLIARLLDWTELKARAIDSRARRAWHHASAAIKALVALVAASIAGAAGVAAYALFLA